MVLWTAVLIRAWSDPIEIASLMISSVGLKVTSLKWTGPEPEDPEVSPEIPQEIEYPDAVQRAADIGFVDENNAHNGWGTENCMTLRVMSSNYPLTVITVLGNSQEATHDVTERQKLRMMIPVSSL